MSQNCCACDTKNRVTDSTDLQQKIKSGQNCICIDNESNAFETFLRQASYKKQLHPNNCCPPEDSVVDGSWFCWTKE